MKAYDSVLHSAVVATLQQAGVDGSMLLCIQDFLSSRSLFVRTSDGDTRSFSVCRGVPQGNVLSPLLFNIIMASLPALLRDHTNITVYADDMCLWTSSLRRDVIQRRLQGALDTVVAYLCDRGLSVSPTKTVAMAFTRRSFLRFPLHVAGSPVHFALSYRYLGIIIDRGLKQLKYLSSKVNNIVSVLRRVSGMSWGPTCADLKSVHCSLVLGTLRYSLPILHGLSRASERELLNLQARSLRVCLGVPKTTETVSVLAEARESPMPTLRDKETLRIYTSIPGTFKKGDHPPVALLQLVLEHLNNVHSRRIAIYTDASVSAGTSTLAVVVPSENYELALRLPHETSSTEAELAAINEALRLISTRPPNNWTVLTDSKAVLQILSSPCSKIVTDICSLALTTYSRLTASGHSVWLQWVPSHIGLPGNTRADADARDAHGAAATTMTTTIPLTPSACLIQIRCQTSRSTLAFSSNAVAANTFPHSIDPRIELTLSQRLSRQEESILHRLRLDVALTPLLLSRMDRRTSPMCPCCAAVADTRHLLLHCKRYAGPRAALASNLTSLGHRELSLATLLGPVRHSRQWAVTRALLCYLKDTGLLSSL
ncbi:uncharacterized protein LOC135385103 [Ornithodoros turicata]|uniref:uncharacterized protein LOC135385103 n=1 Tax=Ornithodoros turicata TaxID=34597 RepID=UPI0031386B42